MHELRHGEHLKNPAARLPNVALNAADGSAASILQPHRSAQVIVIPHSRSCSACQAFSNELVEHWPELAAWDVSVSVIHADTPAEHSAGKTTGPIRVLHDASGTVQHSLGPVPAVVIADEWGEIHDRIAVSDQHDFPDVAEIASWARYLATRCPECEGESL